MVFWVNNEERNVLRNPLGCLEAMITTVPSLALTECFMISIRVFLEAMIATVPC